MTILILAFLPDVEVGALVDTTDGLAASFEEAIPETLPEVDGVALLVPVGVGGVTAGVALSAAVAPIARACVDEASLVDFSMMARCLSSSLARILTRSSGMGLFN
jgi:threonine dehydratase